jgi:pantoate--beta-alanine ligase
MPMIYKLLPMQTIISQATTGAHTTLRLFSRQLNLSSLRFSSSTATLKPKSPPTKMVDYRLMHIIRDIPTLRTHRRNLLRSNLTVGLVPTMGALHEGHISLVRAAAAENARVFVSIYINPTQFGVSEDLSTYPQTWESDLAQLRALDAELAETPGMGRVDTVFAPSTKAMYPTLPPDSREDGVGSFVQITPVGGLLEGKSRPVFFRGVATVCMKLFNLVQAERVYFGQKDVQQTVVVRRMVKDFHLDTQVRIVSTSREEDGLAMSSRNVYLGARRRAVGVVLSRALRAAEEAYVAGKRSRDEILAAAWNVANQVALEQDALAPEQRALFEVDYISLADPDTMEEIEAVDERKGAVLSGAVKMLPLEQIQPGEVLGQGGDVAPVRLIDNIPLEPR